jgi:hypothetical protein
MLNVAAERLIQQRLKQPADPDRRRQEHSEGQEDGLVGLVVSCEMEQPNLQKLLYDIEAGMPFLFVDQLDVQVPQTTSANESGSGRVRVVLGVSGQWQGGK